MREAYPQPPRQHSVGHVISRALVPFPPYRTPPVALTLKGALPHHFLLILPGFLPDIAQEGVGTTDNPISALCKRSTT